ncbi:CapA family protein [Cohnella panacarvi]|uniref:CapA family protein n=1 Tax=Cohnella panacarvi TaxID=400776 RepID=UPI0004794604|nr:CapA family protein [Cohnella panacarvi]
MTYSRTRTNDKRRQRRGRRTRRLLAMNLAMLVCIVGAAAFIWLGQKDDGASGSQAKTDPIVSGSPSAEAGERPTEEASAPDKAEPSDATEDEDDVVNDGVPPGGGEEGQADPGRDTVTIALVGDILPAARVLDYMNQYGFDYPFRETSRLLTAADITAGNLESSITKRGTPEQNKEYVYRGPQEALVPIKEAGFDFLSLANNHTMDYGWEGLSDTMDALDEAGIRHAGSGNDDIEAFTPAYVEAGGKNVAFVGLTQVVPKVEWKADRKHPGLAEAYSFERAVAAVKEARGNADVVVVMVHWGKEREDMPVKQQQSLARALIDAGADLVVGSHPHVLQGFESYKGKWIAYSLGNFVFPGMSPPTTAETGILTATCKTGGECSLHFAPMIAKLAQPKPMDAETGKALLARLSSISFAAAIEEDGTIVAIGP